MNLDDLPEPRRRRMKVPEGRIVRPTLRCLLDDLANEVGPPELRACVPTARRDMAADRRFLFPVALAATQHLVLDRANLLALDSNSDREPIVSITDRSIIKVKTSDRRGALWFDGETWWLLAAGRRKDDGPGDFYRDLEKYGRNSDPIAPTEADRVYLRYETAFLAECAAERDAQMAVVQAVLTATANPGTVETVEVFGAHVAVLIDAEPDDEMLSVSFDFVNFQQRDRFPVDVLGFVPGFESLDNWDVSPALRPGDPETWFAFVPRRWIEYLATAVELDTLVSPERTMANTSPSPRVAHRAAARLVTMSYVEGIEITALCGVQFVAHRDPHQYEECPTCASSLAILRQAAGTDS